MGIKTVFVLTGVADESDLSVAGSHPDWTYPSLVELQADWLAEIEG